MKIVVTHTYADLDALACQFAAAKLYGAVPVGGTSLGPPVVRFLALHKERYPLTIPDDVRPEEVEEVIVVDVRDRRRLKDVEVLLDAAPRIVAWDHHPSSEWDVETDEEYVEPVGSCATLLIERLIAEGIEITPDEATLFLLGVYSDTGRLSYSTTHPRDLAVAGELLNRGAQLKVVNRYLRHTMSDQQSKLLVDLMASTREISIDAVEVAIATAEARKTIPGASAVVQQVMELGGHDAIFGVLYFAKNKRVQIIGRSRVSYIDIGELMSAFNGGGHRGAGAGSIKGATIEDVTAQLEEMLRAAPMQPTRVSEIMSSPVKFLPHDMSLRDAGEQLTEWVVSGAPVSRDGEFCGILSRRDVARAAKSDSLDLPVASFMAHRLKTIDANEPVEDALSLLTESDIGRMPVMSDGEVVGIVTRTDLLRLLYMKIPDDSELSLGAD